MLRHFPTRSAHTSASRHSSHTSVIRHILIGAIATLLPSIADGAAVVRIWDAVDNNGTPAGNNNFYNNINWNGDTRPTFSGNSDAYLFNGEGGSVNLNINGNLTEYLAKNIEFTGAGAYTFTGGQNLTLGDSTTSALNTGFITNRSTGAQNFNGSGRIAFSFGGVNAESGNVTFGNNVSIDIGNGSADAGRNLNITGAFNVVINSAITGLGTNTSVGGAIIKTGSGRLQLQADNTNWGGRVEANEGTIRINKGLALGSTEGDTYVSGGDSSSLVEFTGGISVPEVFRLAGRNSAAPQLSNFSGNNVLTGSIRLDSGGAQYGINSTAGTLTLTGDITYGNGSGASTLNLSGNGNGVINGAIGNIGESIGITKIGTGTWTLNGANATTGPITISQGRLNLTTNHSGGGAVTVSDGATLEVRLAAANSTLLTAGLDLASAGSATLFLDVGTNAFTAPLISTANFSTGTSTINVRGSLSVGQFTLIDYDGLIGGSGFGGITLGTLPLRAIGSLLHDEANSRLVLDITNFDSPKWTGSVSSDWDFDETDSGGLPATENWREINSGLATKYIQGLEGTDQVLFDDTASVTGVNLVGDLSPVLVTVDNVTKDYTFSGFGRLTGATSLVKRGSGALILANYGVNNFTGTTLIAAGSTLQIGDGISEGAGTIGSGRITNDGKLALNRPDAFTLSTPISGDGDIVKQTVGTATLSGNNDFEGLLTIQAGTLKLGNPNALGSTTQGTIVQVGATLDVNGQRTPPAERISVNGTGVGGAGALVNTGTGNIFVGFRNVELTGPATFGGTARFDIRDSEGGLNAAGHLLTKVNSNSIFLANLGETHIGQLLISGGRIAFEGTTTFGDQPGTIIVESGAQLGLEDSLVAHTKPIILQDGTINISSGLQNHLASPIEIDAFGTIQTQTNQSGLISGIISGDGDLAKTGSGTLIIAGNNTYTGRTIVNQGTLRVGNDGQSGSLGPSEISLEAGVGQTATLAFRRSDTELIVHNIISSQGAGTNVLNIGATNGIVPPSAIVTLSGNNSFTGAVNINGGSLRITNSSALGAGPKTIAVQSNNKPSLRLSATGEAIDLPADLSLITSNDDPSYPAILNESGNNTIRGTISLNTGSGGNTRISVAEGTSLTLTGAIAPASTSTSNRTLILDGAGIGAITGVLSDLAAPTFRSLSVTKDGAGTWTLDSDSNYTGPTTISRGTLKVGVSGKIGSTSLIDINAGGILDVSELTSFKLGASQTLSGSGQIVGDIDLSEAFADTGIGGLQLQLGSVEAIHGLTLSAGSLNIGTGVLAFDDIVFITAPEFGPGTYTLFRTFSPIIGSLKADPANLTGFVAGFEAQIALGDNGTDLILNVVPEPGSASMLLLGAALIGLRRRRRQAAVARTEQRRIQ